MIRVAFAGLAIAVSLVLIVPELAPEMEDSAGAEATQIAAAEESGPEAKKDGGRRLIIPSDRNGHYITKFRMNGKPVQALVDTGATTVAIGESMARKLGITLSPKDFRTPVQTANGTIRVATVMLDSVEVGRIRVNKVQAAVLPDDALGGALVGMSFLNKLKSFQVSNRQLTLEQ